jgi:hypothetical protein
MNVTKITALAASAAVAVSALAPAAGMAKATGPGKYTVTKQVYVYKEPGKIFDGTVFKGNTVKVERLSPSGKWAYGMVYGHVNRHDWIDASVLTKKK